MKLRLLSTAATLAVVFPCSRALAFGDLGHRTVAEIAEHYLTPVAQKKVQSLLRAERRYGVKGCQVKSLEDAATWPDCIKKFPNAYKETFVWHYDDIPLCGDADYSSYCPNDQCLSAQVEKFRKVLADAKAPRKDRLQALKFIVHFVGDAHQPLHAEDNGDKGGNDVKVKMPNHTAAEKLHGIWDVGLVVAATRGMDDPGAELALSISADEADSWGKGEIRDWLTESHDLAKTVAYGQLPEPPPCGGAPSGVETIPSEYIDGAGPLLRTQLQKAGVRLASILNEALR